MSTRDGKTGGEGIYAMNASGTAVERLINDPKDDHDPAWSPHGSKIAFARYRDGNDEIYTGRDLLRGNRGDDRIFGGPGTEAALFGIGDTRG